MILKSNLKSIYYFITIFLGIFFISFLLLKDPYDSQLNEKQYFDSPVVKNVNLVFYKKGCPYCKDGKKEVVKYISKSKAISYVVNVDSIEGKKLVLKYDVKYAPTIVYIRGNKVSSFLYADDKNGKIYVEKEKIKEAFEK